MPIARRVGIPQKRLIANAFKYPFLKKTNYEQNPHHRRRWLFGISLN